MKKLLFQNLSSKNNLSAYWRETTSFLTRAFCISLVYGLLPLLRGVGVCFFILVGLAGAFSQNIGINSTGVSPNTSALLDVDAAPGNNKGMLIPRVPLTITTSNAPIGASITTSLLVYNTATINDVTPGYYYWGGAAWVRFNTGTSASNDWTLLGNAATNPATNFIGTTDAQDWVIKTNNTEKVRIINDVASWQAKVAIGGFNNPESNLEIRTSVGAIYIRSYNSNPDQTIGSVLALQRHRGAIGAGTPPLAGDGLGQVDFRGGLSSPISGITAASIKSYSTANWGGTTRGADLRFYTINTTTGGSIFASSQERMIITGNGQIGINTASTANAQLDVRGSGNTSGTFALGVRNSVDTWLLAVRDDGRVGVNTIAPTATLSVNGTADKPGGGTWAVFSDERLKQNIQPFSDGLDKLLQIKPVTFQYNGKAGITSTDTYVGVVAQQVQKVLPYTVKEVEMLMNPEDATSATNVLEYDPNALTYILINSIKEQQKMIEDLQLENEKLKKDMQTQINLILKQLNVKH